MDYSTTIKFLKEEEKRLVQELTNYGPESDTYGKIQQRLKTVREQTNEIAKNLTEAEKNINEKNHQKKKLIADIVLGVLGIAVPAFSTCWWLANGFKFEETGSFSSKTMNWLIQNRFKK